ncbi:MAG: HAD family phosphatase, partial [Sphingomonadaceae bacterium]|nr:HAD family phosphatase [Sphingomonadaceae bacterium]
MKFDAIIFDFDGVIADSELVANIALAEALTGLGSPHTLEDALDHYCGRRWSDCLPLIEARLGRAVPEDFLVALVDDAVARLSVEVAAIEGVGPFLAAHAHRARAIASSSAVEWLDACLVRFGLDHHFGDHVYSAAGIARGKPHPDIYLHVARALGAAPERALVIEDSPTGVAAGVAAG